MRLTVDWFADGANAFMRIRTDRRLGPAHYDAIRGVLREVGAEYQASADGRGVLVMPHDPQMSEGLLTQLLASIARALNADIGQSLPADLEP
jgi:hypothetical protein